MPPKVVRENCQNLVVKKSFSFYFILVSILGYMTLVWPFVWETQVTNWLEWKYISFALLTQPSERRKVKKLLQKKSIIP